MNSDKQIYHNKRQLKEKMEQNSSQMAYGSFKDILNCDYEKQIQGVSILNQPYYSSEEEENLLMIPTIKTKHISKMKKMKPKDENKEKMKKTKKETKKKTKKNNNQLHEREQEDEEEGEKDERIDKNILKDILRSSIKKCISDYPQIYQQLQPIRQYNKIKEIISGVKAPIIVLRSLKEQSRKILINYFEENKLETIRKIGQEKSKQIERNEKQLKKLEKTAEKLGFLITLRKQDLSDQKLKTIITGLENAGNQRQTEPKNSCEKILQLEEKIAAHYEQWKQNKPFKKSRSKSKNKKIIESI